MWMSTTGSGNNLESSWTSSSSLSLELSAGSEYVAVPEKGTLVFKKQSFHLILIIFSD